MKPRWVAAVITLGGFLGLMLGAAVGGALHEPLTGGDEASPVEGLDWMIGGAFVGALVGAFVTWLWALHALRSPQARPWLGAVLGATTLGTAAGLVTFVYRSAPAGWVLPVAVASVLGAAMGAVLGGRIASGWAPPPQTPE